MCSLASLDNLTQLLQSSSSLETGYYLFISIYTKTILANKELPGPNSRWYLNESLEKSLIFFFSDAR